MQFLYLACLAAFVIALIYKMFWYETPKQESTEWFGKPGNYPW